MKVKVHFAIEKELEVSDKFTPLENFYWYDEDIVGKKNAENNSKLIEELRELALAMNPELNGAEVFCIKNSEDIVICEW